MSVKQITLIRYADFKAVHYQTEQGDEATLTPAHKDVALWIADQVNDDGEGFASIGWLAYVTEKSERHIKRLRRDLIVAGVVEVTKKSRGPGMASELRLRLDLVPQREKYSSLNRGQHVPLSTKGAENGSESATQATTGVADEQGTGCPPLDKAVENQCTTESNRGHPCTKGDAHVPRKGDAHVPPPITPFKTPPGDAAARASEGAHVDAGELEDEVRNGEAISRQNMLAREFGIAACGPRETLADFNRRILAAQMDRLKKPLPSEEVSA